jgi:hypothetical protein
MQQGTGPVWRSAAWWGLLFGIGMIGRFLLDTFAPPLPTGYGPRSAVTTWSAVSLFTLTGLMAVYRTRQIHLGPAVAVVVSVVGNALALLATVILFLTVIRNDVQMLQTFEMAGGFGEALFLPVVMIPVVAVIGLIGGFGGLFLRRSGDPIRVRHE